MSSGEQELLDVLLGIKFEHDEYGPEEMVGALKDTKFKNIGFETIKRVMEKHGHGEVVRMYSVGDSLTAKPMELENVRRDWMPVEVDIPAKFGKGYEYSSTIALTPMQGDTQVGKAASEFVVKIQSIVAAPDQPMLLYNKKRNVQTYIHPFMPIHAVLTEIFAADGEHVVNTGMNGKAFFLL
mmetsp:Transcript_11143/g.23949  ORF Transcript_11143/g.23949 Transcript_11143/m.23949 type:complete len:182 (+) Transcript_11143:1165-1710(+)